MVRYDRSNENEEGRMANRLLADLAALPEVFPGMDKTAAPFVYLMGCSSFNQFCCTLRGLIDPKRFCPFCPAERERRNRPALCSASHVSDRGARGSWSLIQNEFPRSDAGRMLLIVPDFHCTDPASLTDEDWGCIGQLVTFCRTELGMEGGGLLMRFGDPHLHAGTIDHLHINMIEPICGREFRMPLGKSLGKHAGNYGRLQEFSGELLTKGGEAWLFSDEGIETTQPKMA